MWMEYAPKHPQPINNTNPIDIIYYYPWARKKGDMYEVDYRDHCQVVNRVLTKEEGVLLALGFVLKNLQLLQTWDTDHPRITIDPATTTVPLGPFANNNPVKIFITFERYHRSGENTLATIRRAK